jgi:hypothetical protein
MSFAPIDDVAAAAAAAAVVGPFLATPSSSFAWNRLFWKKEKTSFLINFASFKLDSQPSDQTD